MLIRFTREWRGYKVGQSTNDVPGGVADLLVRQGIAEVAVEEVEEPVKKSKKAKE